MTNPETETRNPETDAAPLPGLLAPFWGAFALILSDSADVVAAWFPWAIVRQLDPGPAARGFPYDPQRTLVVSRARPGELFPSECGRLVYVPSSGTWTLFVFDPAAHPVATWCVSHSSPNPAVALNKRLLEVRSHLAVRPAAR